MPGKYYYNGISLKEYCENNSISYGTIYSRIQARKKQYPELSDEEIIHDVIENYMSFNTKYYYQGISLSKYCKDNFLNYNKIRARIYERKKEYPNLSDEELVKYAIENYTDSTIKYYYQGILLSEYCKSHSISYDKIYSRIQARKKQYPNLSNEELVKYAIESYINPAIKYYYQGVTLFDYCKKNFLGYVAIVKKIHKKLQEFPEASEEEIVNLVVEEYCQMKEKREYFKRLKEIFQRLETESNLQIIKEYCQFLQINFENVQLLHKLNYTFYQAISMIWYFFDQINEQNQKFLTQKRLQDIQSLCHMSISRIGIYQLIILYKCHLLDTRERIWQIYQQKNKKMMEAVLKQQEKGMSIEQFSDTLNELQICVLEIIDNTYSNIPGEVINYLKKYLKGYFLTYMKKNISYIHPVSLNKEVYEDKKVTKLDFVVNKNQTNETAFSEEMLNVIKELTKEEINFVRLRFQENMSYEELARLYGTFVGEIEKIELIVLEKIKEKLYQSDSLILKKMKI